MSWLSDAWKRNRSAIGNFAKNISPLLAFTPVGALGAGLLAAGGEAARGKTKLSDLLRAGVSNAGIGAGARAGVSRLASSFAPGSSAASLPGAAPPVSSAGVSASSALPTDQQLLAAVRAPAIPPVSAVGATPPPPPGNTVLHALSRPFTAVGSAAKKDPLAALQLIGNTAGGVMDAQAQGAQTDLARQQFNLQQRMYDDQETRRRRLQELLAPLLQPRSN